MSQCQEIDRAVDFSQPGPQYVWCGALVLTPHSWDARCTNVAKCTFFSLVVLPEYRLSCSSFIEIPRCDFLELLPFFVHCLQGGPTGSSMLDNDLCLCVLVNVSKCLDILGLGGSGMLEGLASTACFLHLGSLARTSNASAAVICVATRCHYGSSHFQPRIWLLCFGSSEVAQAKCSLEFRSRKPSSLSPAVMVDPMGEITAIERGKQLTNGRTAGVVWRGTVPSTT